MNYEKGGDILIVVLDTIVTILKNTKKLHKLIKKKDSSTIEQTIIDNN
jgi:hypothetical protein